MSKKRMNKLKVVWLETYLAVIKHGTVEKAGLSLGCHHTTVSRNMKKLENWLGISPLSEIGLKFEPVAREIVDLLKPYGIREDWKPQVGKAKDPKL